MTAHKLIRILLRTFGETDEEKEQNSLVHANPHSLLVQQPDDIKSLHDANDIAKGQERVVISLAWLKTNHDPQKHCHFYCKECPLEISKNDDIIEPCKGHLVRKFIKECWWKCGCSKQCGNRMVQRGISCNLQVRI
ncbi:putative inactive histone-lysine N-methyltransferase SUVR2 [Camellia lanceoleosa]|uniref:Inactive histone-lysine N-methyltransferase SUVR2 n=1 Tax=Camellia lanceoleosa TaxID=1840588 RepID=A0ACC0GEC1_9ERIC|nr:putative inactive histone-lysine N-methyltransferase SUVR2 [Camellia lanceoleosa]